MKITHICLSGPFNEGWNYQENALSLYHKKLGYEISIIASPFINDKQSTKYLYHGIGENVDSNGIKIIRLPLFLFKNSKIIMKLRVYVGLIKILEKENPSIIFIHGLQFLDILKIKKYLKRNEYVVAYIDGHEDFYNSAKTAFSKYIVHKILWKYCATAFNPYVKTFWGVTPSRVEFLTSMYGLPMQKVKLLLMGAEDEKIDLVFTKDEIAHLYKNNDIKCNDFIIVAGGKIDINKSQILLLMDAVKELDNIKLIIFGSVSSDLKVKFDEKLSKNICFIGWQNSEEIYRLFNLANLLVFPGLHSVLWEQAVGQGKPCVFKYIEGFTHVDIGGNCFFLYEDSVKEIRRVLEPIIYDSNVFNNMRQSAQNGKQREFLYSNIARRSIDI
jgi:hypothetical protein